MGKFDKSMCWKHSNCMDVFLYVEKVKFDDDSKNALLHAVWMIQGTASFWPATYTQRIHIEPEQYNHWNPYEPIGELRV